MEFRLPLEPARLALAAPAGLTLGVALALVGLARGDRPLHAYGRTRHGRLRTVGHARTGVALFDVAREYDVVARTSRAASFTREGLDVMGLAVRIPGAAADGGGADLLLASTGTSVLGRHVLALRNEATDGPLTTLLPMRAGSDSVVLGAAPLAADEFWLGWSRVGQRHWTPVGRLTLLDDAPDPGPLDPLRPPAGLRVPSWVANLRGPAYAFARRVPTRRG